MPIVSGGIIASGEHLRNMANFVKTAIFTKKEIYAAGRSPETYDQEWIECFNASSGDNSTVQNLLTTAGYDTTNKLYQLDGFLGNAGFEGGNNGLWTLYTTGAANQSATISYNYMQRTGMYCGQLFHDNNTVGSYVEISQAVDLTGVTTISFYFRWEAAYAYKRGSFIIDDTEHWYIAFIDTTGSSPYTLVNVTGLSYTGVHTIRFRLARTGGGVCYSWIDDITTNLTKFKTSGLVRTATVVTTTSNINGVFIHVNKTTPTNTTLNKCDISIDGGTTFTLTNQNFDTFIDTSSLTGTMLQLKFYLSTTDTSVTPLLKDYGVICYT